MTRDEASSELTSAVAVTREDIARAKAFILASNGTETHDLAEEWLLPQVGRVPNEVDIHSAGAEDALAHLARAYSLRLAFYQAVWELVVACELLPAGGASWKPGVSAHEPWGSGGLELDTITCVYPSVIRRPPLRPSPSTDPDVFLEGAQCVVNHPGIREAVSQSLGCFRRGLYLPAIVMLAAGAEAAWIECGTAIAVKLLDERLREVMNDSVAGFGRKVAEVRKTLERAAGKELLKLAGASLAKVADAALWTTTLRERRNAVHWGKMESFIAQHSDAASLILAAPLHFGTLQAVQMSAMERGAIPNQGAHPTPKKGAAEP